MKEQQKAHRMRLTAIAGNGFIHWLSPPLNYPTQTTPWEHRASLLLKPEEERSKEPPPMPVQEQNYESAKSNAEKWSEIPQTFMYGAGYSVIQSVEGLVYAVKHPVKTMFTMAAVTDTGSDYTGPWSDEYVRAEANLYESYHKIYYDFVNGDVLNKLYVLLEQC